MKTHPMTAIAIKRKGEAWSPEEERRLLEALAERRDVHAIALEHQRTPYAITMRIQALVQRFHRRDGKTVYELATIFNKTANEIQEILRGSDAPADAQGGRARPSGSGGDLAAVLQKIESRLGAVEEAIDKILQRQTRILRVIKGAPAASNGARGRATATA